MDAYMLIVRVVRYMHGTHMVDLLLLIINIPPLLFRFIWSLKMLCHILKKSL
jgi:hypothetical protein